MTFLEVLRDLLGERDLFGVRLLLGRERDLERDSFRHLPGLRERDRDRGICNLKSEKSLLKRKAPSLFIITLRLDTI